MTSHMRLQQSVKFLSDQAETKKKLSGKRKLKFLHPRRIFTLRFTFNSQRVLKSSEQQRKRERNAKKLNSTIQSC